MRVNPTVIDLGVSCTNRWLLVQDQHCLKLYYTQNSTRVCNIMILHDFNDLVKLNLYRLKPGVVQGCTAPKRLELLDADAANGQLRSFFL